eukprot:4408766-Pleurochrysis_carterae.AAC.1
MEKGPTEGCSRRNLEVCCCGRCVERPKASHARTVPVLVASFRSKKPTKTVKGQAARKAPTKGSMVTVE